MTYNNGKVSTGPALRSKKRTAQSRLDTKNGKEVRCDARPWNHLRTTEARKCESNGRWRKGGDLFEYLLPFVESQEIGRAHHATIQSSPMKKERHQAVGLTIGERLQHDAVDDGENGRIGADSKGQGEHGYSGEAGILEKHANSES